MPRTVIVVPARLASVRFPRKLLYELKGKPLILWTAERIRSEAPEFPLRFAVAETELAKVLEQNGFDPVLTDPDLPSGTDRIAQANAKIGAERVINVQADEPLVTKEQIHALDRLLDEGADMATLARRFAKPEDFQDHNKVKVVRDARGNALYFSRSPIPFHRDTKGAVDRGWLAENPCYWHLGMYAYTAAFLNGFSKLPPGKLEGVENLEQLRALEHGYTLAVGVTDQPTVGIDTPEDIESFLRATGSA